MFFSCSGQSADSTVFFNASLSVNAFSSIPQLLQSNSSTASSMTGALSKLLGVSRSYATLLSMTPRFSSSPINASSTVLVIGYSFAYAFKAAPLFPALKGAKSSGSRAELTSLTTTVNSRLADANAVSVVVTFVGADAKVIKELGAASLASLSVSFSAASHEWVPLPEVPTGDPSWYMPVIAALIAVGVLVFIVAALYAAFWAREQILQKRKQAAQLQLLKEYQAKFPHLHIPVKVVRDEAAEQAAQAAADLAAWEMAKAAAAPQVPAKAAAVPKRLQSADSLASIQAETATLPDITPVEPAIYNGSFADNERLSATTQRSPKSSEAAAREPRRSPASAASSAERPRRSKPNSPSIEL